MEEGAAVAYPVGRVTAESWHKAVLGPTVAFSRCEDAGSAVVSPFNPAAAGRVMAWQPGTGRIALLRNGTEIASGENPFYAELPGMSPRTARYTLRLDAQRDDPAWQLASEVSAAWTFVSSRPADGGCLPQPVALPQVRVDGDFDLENRAPAGRPLVLSVRVDQADGSRVQVRRFEMEASYDGGATWRRLPAVPVGDGYTVPVPPAGPRGGDGFVALRTSVRDARGTTVTQTVLRAFRAAPRP
jgi:hypothetical protein